MTAGRSVPESEASARHTEQSERVMWLARQMCDLLDADPVLLPVVKLALSEAIADGVTDIVDGVTVNWLDPSRRKQS